jgi:sugar lactone lactonase YvrE
MDFTEATTGYCLLEAPRADGDAVWFSDPVLGGLMRLGSDGRVETFVPELKRIGGAALDESGAVVFSTLGGIGWLDPATGRSGMLDTIDGRPLSAANDIFPDGRGGLIFGTAHDAPSDADLSALTTELYRLAPNGGVALLWEGLQVANGIGLSPDGRRLYVNESWLATFAYDIGLDGGLANRRLFFDQEDCDGLAVDSEGGVWIACFASGAVVRVLADGTLDRRVAVPAKSVTSLCFGGPDWRDVFVTSGGDEGLDLLMAGRMPGREASLFRARSDVAGLPVSRTRFDALQEMGLG